MIRFITITLALSIAALVSGCNTWAGAKQDAKAAGQATGQAVEKAGEKIQSISK